MPFIFQSLCAHGHKDVYVEHVTKGKYTFNLQSKRKKVLETIVGSKKWDLIVLQGSSRDLLKSDSILSNSTFPAIRKLLRLIERHQKKAKVVFYMTWPYKYGYDKLIRTNTRKKMFTELEKGYLKLKSTFHHPIIPVGMVWNSWMNKHSSLNLYTSDRAHPSYFGSYLVACCFYDYLYTDELTKNKFHGLMNRNVAKKMRAYVSNQMEQPKSTFWCNK